MKLPIYSALRNLAIGMKNATDFGTPYENISIFAPQIIPTGLGGVGAEPITEEDHDEHSKWENDMRRQGPFPPPRDTLEKDYEPMSTVNDEIPAGVGFDAEGPKTDAQGMRTRNTPEDPEPGIIDPVDLNGDTFSPAGPDDLGSAGAR